MPTKLHLSNIRENRYFTAVDTDKIPWVLTPKQPQVVCGICGDLVTDYWKSPAGRVVCPECTSIPERARAAVLLSME